MRFRFSIPALMATVLLVAVGVAALRDGPLLWASGLFTLTVALLSTAVLGAIACRGRARMSWTGFAVFGWAYILTTFGLWPAPNGVTAPPYITKAWFDHLQPDLVRPLSPDLMIIDSGQTGETSYRPPRQLAIPAAGPRNPKMVPFTGWVVDRFQYRRIGHTLAAILFGLVGAAVGRCMAAREEWPPAGRTVRCD